MPYKCGFGHTQYHPQCDACDDEVSDQTTGWAQPAKDIDDTFKAALKGRTLKEYRDEDDDEDDAYKF